MGYSYTFSATIFFILVSIVVQGFDELLMLQHPVDGSTRKLTCVSENDDSALIWNHDYETNSEKNDEEDFQPSKPKPANIYDCAIWWNSTVCRAQWENTSGWKAVNSSMKPMAPVFDFRWEGFREFSSEAPDIDNADYQYIGKADDSSGNAAFSVRGIRNVHVFLCENSDPTNGACLWIFLKPYKDDESLLRPCPRGVNGGKEPLRKKICGDESYSTRSEDEDLLYKFEWRTLRLEWMKEENKIQVFRYNDPEDRPFLEAPWSSLPHILIRSQEGTRLRFHFYEYFLTKTENSVLNTKEFRYHGEYFCIDLLVSLCPKCELRVSLVSDDNTTLKPWIIPGNDKSAEEGMLTWRSVRLIKSAQITDPILVRLKIETVLMGGKGKGRWAIDNFRMCELGSQVRKSTITIPRDESAFSPIGQADGDIIITIPRYESAFSPIRPYARCQRLSYTKSAVVDSNSKDKIDNGTIESQRYIDELVKSCGPSCQSFGENYSLRNSIGFTCGRGFNGSDCNQQCPRTHYGYNCNGVCATRCSSCNQITGECDSCERNTFLPPRCKTEIKDFTVTNVTATTAIVSLKIEPEADAVADLGVEIRVKDNESLMKFTVNLEKSGMSSYYVAHISGLTPDTIYTASATAKLAGQTGPEMQFTTICIGDPKFTVETNETYLTLEMTNPLACFKNPDPVYSVLVYDPANLTAKWEYDDVRFPASIDKLTPWTEYQVDISDNTMNKPVFTTKVRTLESAPSEVRNLIPTSITENGTVLRWDPPLQRNGNITHYDVSVKLVKPIACKESEATGHHNQPMARIVGKTTATILGLHPYAEYQVRVTAHTSKPGEPKTVRFNTLETAIPTSKFSNFSIDNNSKTLSWDEPADCKTVTGPTNRAKLFLQSINDSVRNFTVIKQTAYKFIQIEQFGTLTAYTEYKVRLHVIRGQSINDTCYQELTWRTPATAPPAVTDLEIYDADIETNSISLRWIPPSPANGVIESYQVSIIQEEKTRSKITIEVSKVGIQWELKGRYVSLRNFTVPSDIKSNSIYKIQVRAINEGVKEAGESSIVPIGSEIYDKEPGDPEILAPTSRDHGIMLLKWLLPTFSSTKITGFYIHARQVNTKLRMTETHEVSKTVNRSVDSNQSEYSVELHLRTSTVYSVSVLAVNQRNITSSRSNVEEVSVPGHVFFANGTKLHVKQTRSSINVTVPVIGNATTDTTVEVIVHGLTTCTGINPPKRSIWHAVSYKQEENKPTNVVIGSNQEHTGGLNCSFSMGETYRVEINATDFLSGTSDTLTSSPITLKILTTPSNDVAWFAVLPLLAVCMLVVFVYYRIRRRVARRPRKPSYLEPRMALKTPNSTISQAAELLRKKETETAHITIQWRNSDTAREPSYLEVISPPLSTALRHDSTVLYTSNSSTSRSEAHVYALPNAPDSCSVNIKDFEEYAKKAATSRRLYSQFVLLRGGPTRSTEYGSLRENMSKNRNLIAYDDTRVVLEKIPGDQYSDYINASYVEGYKNERVYIAAQGPMPNTIQDFWRMVWQEKVRVICMLTNVVEGNETKCEKYWPDVGTSTEYGDFHISNTEDQVFADYTIRTFQLSYKRVKREVKHLHYTGWPSLGVPTNPQSLVAYLRKLEQTSSRNDSVVIHCSTGDDRTGTIILCAICLRQAVAEKVIDVAAVITRMRDSRANLVGTLQQYVLAHVIITESLVSRPTQIPCTDVLSTRMNQFRMQLPHDIQRLNDTAWQQQALESSAALRISCAEDVVEFENLPKPVPGSNEVIYDNVYARERNRINAVSVDGVKVKKQYLACWLPSPLMLSHFWDFVIERDVKLIVILQCSDPRDASCRDIVPDESIVLPMLDVKVKNQTNIKEGEHYTREEISFTGASKENAGSRSVTVLTCKGWGCGLNQKPPEPAALVSLWRASMNIPRKEDQTLVLCHDGITGCGLYLALGFLLERMAAEGECDVVSAVRAVRQSRPEFVQLPEQFEYLYDAAVKYVESFQTYANFP